MATHTASSVKRILIGFASIVYVTFYYCFIEWLFISTRWSFLGPLPWYEKVWIGILAFLFCLILALVLTALIALPGWVAWALGRPFILHATIRSAAALILASALFMMANNFSYTTTGIGVYYSVGLEKWFFRGLFLALLLFSYSFLAKLGSAAPDSQSRAYWMGALLVGVVAVWHTGALLYRHAPLPRLLVAQQSNNARRPNILVIGTDAVSADLFSLYGGKNTTTPFLDSIAGDLLVVDNVLPNVNESSGSVLTLLSGKSPASTRVLTYPDIVSPNNSYEHLPLILKQLGYQTIELSVRNWADSFDLNFREAFDSANGRRFTEFPYSWLSHFPSFYSSYEFYLVHEFVDHLERTLLYAFDLYHESLEFSQVAEQGFSYESDLEKIQTLLALLNTSRSPVFAHLHLLGTHGPKYQTRHKTFLDGNAPLPQDMAGLLDAILDFDSLIQKTIEALETSGRLDDTIVVIYSDHGHNYGPLERVPLAFRFPAARPAGRVKTSAQLADVAPTLLSYMQLPIPSWMEGNSLLTAEGLDPMRKLFSFSTVYPFEGQLKLDPVFYTLVSMQAFTCNQYLALDIQKRCINSGTIPGHSSPCPSGVATNTLALDLLGHLDRHNLNTTSIRAALLEADSHRCAQP